MTKNKIRTKLQAKESNMRRFATQYEHHYRTVVSVIDRYAGTQKQQQQRKKPRSGTTTYQILCDLSKFIGEPVIDGFAELIEGKQS